MSILEKVHQTWWDNGFQEALDLPQIQELKTKALPSYEFFPKAEDIFNVFRMPLNEIKVVILGQDPYPTRGDAIGYAFAVHENKKLPASLRNIEKEIFNEGQNYFEKETESYWKTLQHWRDQGIFLLNAALTVKAGVPGSHSNYWYGFTKKIIEIIALNQSVIWILWGKKAQTIFWENFPKDVRGASHIKLPIGVEHHILESPHPAAENYSSGKAGFFGNNHFKLTNQLLEKQGKDKILW